MTNGEKYKQAFSALHASDNISLEVKTMKKTNMKFKLRPALAACLTVVMLMGAAYAADVGGIRETIQIWINGEQVDADVVDDTGTGDGGYAFTYQDSQGKEATIGGGGVAIDEDGAERPLTAEEVAEQFDGIVDYDANGRVCIFEQDKVYDITDLLVDGKCKVSLERDGATVYYDIEDNGGGGWAFSRTSEPVGSAEDYTALTQP